MDWAKMVPAFSSILGAIMGMESGREMERAGRRESLMADQNAMLEKRELQEQVRRQTRKDRQLRASALARAAASGATLEGTPGAHLAYLEEEQGREMDWLKSSGASAIRLRLQAAKMSASATKRAGKTQQFTSFFGGITSAFGFADKAGMFTKEVSKTT